MPRELIAIFNDHELELLISGLPDIDVGDLRANTQYSGYSPASTVIQWFWQVVGDMEKQDLALLLQFVTGEGGREGGRGGQLLLQEAGGWVLQNVCVGRGMLGTVQRRRHLGQRVFLPWVESQGMRGDELFVDACRCLVLVCPPLPPPPPCVSPPQAPARSPSTASRPCRASAGRSGSRSTSRMVLVTVCRLHTPASTSWTCLSTTARSSWLSA